MAGSKGGAKAVKAGLSCQTLAGSCPAWLASWEAEVGCAVRPGIDTCDQQPHVLLLPPGHPLTIWPVCTCWRRICKHCLHIALQPAQLLHSKHCCIANEHVMHKGSYCSVSAARLLGHLQLLLQSC